MKGVVVRKLEPRDLQDIAVLLAPHGDKPGHRQDVEKLAGELARDMDLSFVALQGKKILACLITSQDIQGDDRRALIFGLFTRPGLDMNEIGNKLLDSLKKEISLRNLSEITIQLQESDTNRISLFEKSGFSLKERTVTMQYMHGARKREKH